jgi:uracil phosphoribosyltransferase
VSATASGGYTYVANPPTNVVATATSTTSVQVSWTAAPGATSYDVLRSSNGVSYAPLAGISGTTYTDLSASPNTAYLYAVRASAPNVSDNSTPDLATAVIFTDPALVTGATMVKAVHLTQLRTAVNAVRQLAGLTTFTYTDPTITPGVTIVKSTHVTELRTALGAARTALSLPAINYSHATLTTGMSLISAADIRELRSGTQ